MKRSDGQLTIDAGRTRMWSTWRRIAGAVAMMWVAGCGDSLSPTTPSSSPAPAVPAAVLEISTYDVEFAGISSGMYWYLPKIVLTEKSQKSVAILQRLVFSLPSGDTWEIPILGCSGEGSEKVASGGTWDTSRITRYCRDIDYRQDLAGSRLHAMILFTDANGVLGWTSASAVIPSAPKGE